MTGGPQPYGQQPYGRPSLPTSFGPAGPPGTSGKTSALATVSVVLSLVGVPFTLVMLGVVFRFSSGLDILGFGLLPVALAPVMGLAGAIVGHVALRQIKRTGQLGRGRAITGIVVGWVTVALFTLLVVLVAVLVSQLSR